MVLWSALLDILILLAAAMVLGGLCERLRQSPLLGYLLAGTLLGPNALDLLPSHAAVAAISELGVALLLFTIGLEFSWRRLRSIGPIALFGGTLQVLVTGALAAGVSLAFGLDARASVVVGAMIAFSSTAAVVRLLAIRAELDAVHGRNALGILLLQDIAVVPVLLVVVALGGGASAPEIGWAIGRAVGLAVLLVGALHLFLSYVLPLLLGAEAAARNRDFPILLAIVTAVGAGWLSHALGFSPLLGSFLAGMLLAESPFATQIRADVVPLQTLFVTLFFSSIGMLSDPAWALDNWAVLSAVVAAVVMGKTAVTSGIVRLFRFSLGLSVATGIALAQVGEFSLVVAVVARDGGLIAADVFDLIVATLTITLFLTPYLIALGPHLARAVARLSTPVEVGAEAPAGRTRHAEALSGHLVIVGFGPAGQRVAEALMGERDLPILVIEQNPRTAAHARAYGLRAHVGDATREEILERFHLRTAAAVAVTIPDPTTARQIVQRVRSLAPDVPIVVRARYHIHRWQLDVAGAHAVVDEEEQVGLRIAEEVRATLLREPPIESD